MWTVLFTGHLDAFSLKCVLYMYFFFLDELRKFTISDFPKQTHLGYTLITLFFFQHPIIDPHFTKMLLSWLH